MLRREDLHFIPPLQHFSNPLGLMLEPQRLTDLGLPTQLDPSPHTHEEKPL